MRIIPQGFKHGFVSDWLKTVGIEEHVAQLYKCNIWCPMSMVPMQTLVTVIILGNVPRLICLDLQ